MGNTGVDKVFGLEQLCSDSLFSEILIASGLKDLMCLNEMGFTAVAPMSESINLPQSVIETLKLSDKRVIYLYDTDLAGLKCGVKYACLNGFEAIWLPKIQGQSFKDVADFVQFYGIDEVKELIKVMINNKLN
jgi:DNA primase